MKKLCRKRKSSSSKGKIHPSPSHTSTTPSLSVLNLLPSPILLTIVSLLSPDDQQVLAYLIHRSITTTTTSTSTFKKCNKPTASSSDCGCFDCYTRFWIRWDSSPNRHLIHQAIEAFEDHLSSSDHASDGTQKSKPRNSVISADKSAPDSVSGSLEPALPAAQRPEQCSDGEHERTGNRLQPVASAQEQRGLVRKVWPDVLGLFNSRLWSLWNPSL